MTTEENKLEILRKVESGTLSVEEGSDLLGILDRAEPDRAEKSESIPQSFEEETIEKHEVSGCWKAAWSSILIGGSLLSGFSVYWMFQGYNAKGLSWGFWLSWIPLAIGVLIMILGWALMTSPWMHLKVKTKEEGKNVNIDLTLPVPLNLVRWFFRNFGQYLPANVQDKGIPDLIEATEASLKKGEPFHVQVDDEDDGTQVEISIN